MPRPLWAYFLNSNVIDFHGALATYRLDNSDQMADAYVTQIDRKVSCVEPGAGGFGALFTWKRFSFGSAFSNGDLSIKPSQRFRLMSRVSARYRRIKI
jgi:hypothetical protein